MIPIALFIFGIGSGSPVKSVKCTTRTTGGRIQICTVTLRRPALSGERITLIHSATKSHKDPATGQVIVDSKDGAASMWEFGVGAYKAGVTTVDLCCELPETEVVGVRYDGRGSVKAVPSVKSAK